MLEASREADFFEEAVGAQSAGDLLPQHLERDRPPVLEVAGETDRGHAAPPELALDRVAGRNSSPE